MTVSDKQQEPGTSFCLSARISGAFLALLGLAIVSSSVAADDAEIGKLLKAKGVEVKESKGTITALTVKDGSKLTDEDFRQIARLSHLKTLSLSNGLNDDRLSQLAGLAELESLQTNLAQITDAGIKPLAQLKNLKTLKFFHPGKAFSGAGLVHLASLPNLQSLTVAGSLAFNDDGLAAVAKLTGLKEFRTWHAGSTNEGVKKLKELKNLKSLYLGQRLSYKPPACPTDETIAAPGRHEVPGVLAARRGTTDFCRAPADQAIVCTEEVDARRNRHSEGRGRASEARAAPGEDRMDRTNRGVSEADSSAVWEWLIWFWDGEEKSRVPPLVVGLGMEIGHVLR